MNRGVLRPTLDAARTWSTLSTEQLRFYFLHQMDPADPDIYICRTLRVTGRLDHARLAASVRDLAARHDILRSCYATIDGEPRIGLRPDVADAVVSLDLSALSAAARGRAIAERVAAELAAREPLSLDGPVFRITAIRAADDDHVVVVRFHHVAIDGTSARLFLDELWRVYAAAIFPSRQPRPTRQYVDYVEHERDRIADRARHDDRAYWARKLANAAALDLAIGRTRPARHTGAADTVHLTATPGLVAALRALSKAHRVTPYTVMMAALQAALRGVAGDRAFVIGTPIANRGRRDLMSMLGVLINWIAVRVEPRGDATFADAIARIRLEVPEAYVRQCAYDALLAAAGPSLSRDPSRNPLVQVTLNYATYPDLVAPAGLDLALDPVEPRRTPYDLSVRFEEVGDELRLGLTYYTGAMDRPTAERFAAALLAIAERGCRDPDRPLAELRLPDDLVAAARATPAATRRIAIAATFTAEPLAPALAFWLDQLGLPAELEVAPIDTVFQALLPDGRFAGGAAANVILIRLEDWRDEPAATAQLLALLAAHGARSATETVVVIAPPSADRRAVPTPADHELDRALGALGDADRHLHVVTWRAALARYPVDAIDDLAGLDQARAPYTEDVYVALGTAVARAIHAALCPAPKVLLLDCDNTLWSGVLGEDGVDGVVVDAARAALQRFALDRRSDGILLGLVSKNEAADVWDAFARVPGMVLRREHIAAHRIDWERKSDNIRAIAAELNLGVESFVFVDDSPAECAEVAAACPGVLVYQAPTDPAALTAFLAHLWPLDPRKTTAADRDRAAQYAANAQRDAVRSTAADLAELVANLAVRTTLVPTTDDALARAAQLTQRTNQFNTTTIRRSEAELRAVIAGGGDVAIVDVSDRFGDYGLVGVAVHHPERDALVVDAMLLSCRALGRGVEHTLLAMLGEVAAGRGLTRVDVAFRPSAKNRPAHRFLDALAAEHAVADADGGAVYRIPVADALAAPRRLVAVDDAPAPTAPAPAVALPAAHALWPRVIRELASVAGIRAAIDRALAHARPRDVALVGPRDDLEAAIAGVWAGALHLDAVGVTDDYFALGGDSIRSLAVTARLRAAGIPATVPDVHHHRTVAALAAAVRARLPAAAAERAVAFDRGEPYPLGHCQRFVVEAYARANLSGEEPTGAYHIQERLVLRAVAGDHDLDALRAAIAGVLDRTPVLRTRLERGPAGWRQAELVAAPAVTVVDLRAEPAATRERRVAELLHADRMRPFDPERDHAPMMRFYAVRHTDAELELIVTAHHGFCDGWSLHDLYGHLFALYEARRRGDVPAAAAVERALAAPGRSFRDLVAHERGGRGAAERAAFWARYLPDRLGDPAPRAGAGAGAGYQPRLVVEAAWQLVERATERARAARTSVKAVCLEAFAAALARQRGDAAPLVIATVTNGRSEALPAPTEVFGLCWTLVPIVARPGDRAGRLAALHADLLATEAHAGVPIEDMFAGRAPDATVAASFNLTNFHNARWRDGVGDLRITQLESFHRFHFPINFGIRIVEPARAVTVKLTWSRAAFDEDRARALIAGFAAELEGSAPARAER